VDAGRYPVSKHDGPPTVLWTGSRTTVPYLETAAEPLGRLAAEGVRIRVVADARPRWDVPTEFVPWSRWSEKMAFEGASVGLAPLPDVPYAQGKCAFKVVQYMAAGLPVAASDVGANREMFERHGCRGALVERPEGFYEVLSTLLKDKERRIAMGAENAMAARGLDVSALVLILEKELRRAAA
jgi:glycosyltransferase involved in cell wall biosynthesis